MTIRDIFELREMCDIDGSHWIWTGPVKKRSRTPYATVAGVKGRRFGMGITAALLGEQLKASNTHWYAACGQWGCVSPKCLRQGGQRELQQAKSKAGVLKRGLDNKAKLTALRRQRPDVAPDWMVQWALESPQSAAEAGWGLGRGKETVSYWRRNAHRQSSIGLVSNPFNQLLRMAA